MADTSSILKFAASVGNRSGAIKAAPQGLLKLKESIEGLPFELLQKSMSGIFDGGKLMAGIQQLGQQMGGLQNIGGSVQPILGKIANGTVTEDELINAVGGVTAMTAGLSTFLSPSDTTDLHNVSPGTQTTKT